MSYYNSYKAGLNSKNSPRERSVDHMQKVFSSSFNHSVSYEEVIINNKAQPVGVQIVADTKVPSRKKILMQPGDTVQAGDVIERHNGTWLCLSEEDKVAYMRGYIEKCEIDLKWVDDEGVVQSQPSVFYFNTKSNFGDRDDRIMTLPDGRRQTIVQRNSFTEKLKRNQRFIIGGEAFEVIDSDFVSDKGLVNLSLKSHLIDPATDNLELGIADYFKKKSYYSIRILNGKEASVRQDQQIKVNAEASNGLVKISNPELLFESLDENIALVNENGYVTPVSKGSTKIIVRFKDQVAELLLYVTDSITYNYSSSIIGEDQITYETTEIYSCMFENNGIQFEDESLFWLTNEDGSDTDLVQIVSQDHNKNTCVLRAGKRKNKYTTERFVLNVKNQNGLAQTRKVITMKSLF